LSDTITVNVTVAAVNDAPSITDGTSVNVSMSEDSNPTPFSLTLNATDVNGGTLTWSILTNASNGTATASGTGLSKAISYTPTANYNGTDSFVVQVSDGALTDTITVNVTVTAVDDLPFISHSPATPTGTEDGSAVAFNISYGDSDNSPTLNLSTPSSGVVDNVGGSGSPGNFTLDYTYTPNADFNGSDSFVATLTSGGVTLTDTVIVGLLNNYIFIIIKHMILYIFYFKYSVIRL